jgi:hypothetical protein
MTRRTVADEPKYYDFEIALTVDSIWCEEDEDGPRIDYRGYIRKVEEEDVVGRVRSTSMEICRLKHVRPSVLKTYHIALRDRLGHQSAGQTGGSSKALQVVDLKDSKYP